MRELLELEAQNELARCAIHREVVHYRADTLTCDSEMALPSETPVALVYNGIAHSVMMCSASDLEDFAIGFSLSEGIIDSLLDIHDIEQIDGCQGIELHITLANRCVHRLKEKRRTPALAHFCTISKLARLVTRMAPSRRPVRHKCPTSLSSAIWRPTSSRMARILPSPSRCTAAWVAPVRWPSSWSGRSALSTLSICPTARR